MLTTVVLWTAWSVPIALGAGVILRSRKKGIAEETEAYLRALVGWSPIELLNRIGFASAGVALLVVLLGASSVVGPGLPDVQTVTRGMRLAMGVETTGAESGAFPAPTTELGEESTRRIDSASPASGRRSTRSATAGEAGSGDDFLLADAPALAGSATATVPAWPIETTAADERIVVAKAAEPKNDGRAAGRVAASPVLVTALPVPDDVPSDHRAADVVAGTPAEPPGRADQPVDGATDTADPPASSPDDMAVTPDPAPGRSGESHGNGHTIVESSSIVNEGASAASVVSVVEQTTPRQQPRAG